ncbi:uncharacterized protein LOC114163466 [Vigna unguiculata]|uniref:uncharacterized protein LOC114163466 n=1 Tax=Vigna unguiculata TaxID=3917 RepID=UPI0010163752|nr:uncharacterized protein LOC114163466 [Vigna unguiculata]
MHNFKILKNEGQYRVCEHPYKLLFIGATSVKLQAIAKLPMKAYNFKSIKDIVSGNFIPDLLIDLIGVVENVRIKPQFKSVESKNVVFTLVDLSGAAICCTLWDEYCKKFIQRYNDVANSEKLVVVITQAKIKPAAGEWPVSVSNTWNGTKLIMESDFPQIVDFKKRMKEYRLQVQVCDDSNNYANFVVWDQECSNIIGLSAADLQKQMIEAGEDDPLCFPDALDVMLGCTFAFKVRTQPRTKCASVIKVSNVSEIVAHVKSLIPPLQIGDGTDKRSMDLVSESSSVMVSELRGKAICNLAADIDTDIMSLSATGDNESDYVVIGTPGKRLLPCNENWNESSQDIDSAQLSSTKMKKLIKKEKT